MAHIRYRIPLISVAALTAYAKEVADGVYSYNLNKAETQSVIIRGGNTLQDDNAIFYQAMQVITLDQFEQPQKDCVIEDLYEVLPFFDFSGIFDYKNASIKKIVRSKKAESIFRPDGVVLDFGNGPQRFHAFERSASMSRQAKLSFINEKYVMQLKKRATLDLKLKECQLSKLYAYNGLLYSSGNRADLPELWENNSICVIDNPEYESPELDIITVKDVSGVGSTRTYKRAEEKTRLKIKGFDGEGLISPDFAEKLDIACYGQHTHHSFQIRMPYIKGMVHEVDFKGIFHEAHIKNIYDIWGRAIPIDDVKIILTKSQFKAFGWFKECQRTWFDYLSKCKEHNHALYVTNVGKENPEGTTELNYQFLNTVSVSAEDFRPADLPLGWTESPETDTRHWLTKATETKYYKLVADKEYQKKQFERSRGFFEAKDKEYYLSRIIEKNPKFLNESAYSKQLGIMADKVLKEYAVGRLIVAGDNRFLSADLLSLISHILYNNPEYETSNKDFVVRVKSVCLAGGNNFFAAGASYASQDEYTVLRSPHIARNEELIVKKPEFWVNTGGKYLNKLTDVIIVAPESLFAERLGGADYDGDMVKTIADPIIVKSVKENYTQIEGKNEMYDNENGLPILVIPTAEPQMADPNDWRVRLETVKSTFSSRIGQISNAALNRSIIAYDENADSELKERCRQETETLAILTGLEIDSAKSGIKPNLTEYLECSGIKRSKFLKYKDLLEKQEKRRKWYEEDFGTQYRNYFGGTDWDKVTSNVEKLPYFAYMLKKNTPRLSCKQAKPEELFTFATKKDWQKSLRQDVLDKLSEIITTYTSAIKRIAANKYAVKSKSKQKDINRILYIRDQDGEYDSDTLYGLFVGMDADKIHTIRKALKEEKWHLMPEEKRYVFLNKYLPSDVFSEYYDLFADFGFGGYRVLGDIICDIDDELYSSDHSRLHFETDSEDMTELINAYIDKPIEKTDREALADCCHKLIKNIISPTEAVKYVVALNKREFLWDVLTAEVYKWVLKVRDDG